eukprot:PhM_4_TR8219/c0_g1_i1/m.56824/K08823/CLK; CDC-like kinase
MDQHAHATIGTVIAGRYRVVREAGTGNFARVFVCADTRKSDVMVAVKLLKRGYDRDAEFERDVLAAVGKRDPEDRHNIVKMLSYFKWHDHSCFAFNLKGIPLKNKIQGAPGGRLQRHEVAAIARDLADSMQFLHSTARVIHTDLKPENLLQEIPRFAGERDRWAVCDLGSASFISERCDSDLISTRPYRAPEVVVGSEWTAPVDMWSVGCILYEAYTGKKLFDAVTDDAHLAAMELHLGSVPESVIRRGNPKQLKQIFTSDWRLRCAPARGRRIQETLQNDAEFLDLIMGLLRYEPHRRLQARDMMHHPFLNAADERAATSSDAAPAATAAHRTHPSVGLLALGSHYNGAVEVAQQQQHPGETGSPQSTGSVGYRSTATNSPVLGNTPRVNVGQQPVTMPPRHNHPSLSRASSSIPSASRGSFSAVPLPRHPSASNLLSNYNRGSTGIPAPMPPRTSSSSSYRIGSGRTMSPAFPLNNSNNGSAPTVTTYSTSSSNQKGYIGATSRIGAAREVGTRW